MPEKSARTRNWILDPSERISEIFFGLIMVLTVIGSLQVAQGGVVDAHAIVFAALGCNLAWGLIDAITYAMGRLTERGHDSVLVEAARNPVDPTEARRIIAESLPSPIASQLPEKELEVLRQSLLQLTEVPADPRPTKEDWLGALGVFLLVFLSTFPVVLPFMTVKDAHVALRVSYGAAVTMLYLSGYGLGRYAGYRPWKVGVAVTLIGLAMVGITIALGG